MKNKRLPIIVAILSVAALTGLFVIVSKPYSDRQIGGRTNLDRGFTVICFGDSITEGQRLNPSNSYPAYLQRFIGATVLNEGISGETSTEALARVKKDVIDRHPRLVVLQFGGNDPPNRIPFEVTMANNDILVKQLQAAGITVVLLLGESNMLVPKYLQGFRELAERRKVLLLEDAIDEIVRNPKLRRDSIHPNTKGNKVLAQEVYQAIKPLL